MHSNSPRRKWCLGPIQFVSTHLHVLRADALLCCEQFSEARIVADWIQNRIDFYSRNGFNNRYVRERAIIGSSFAARRAGK